MLLPGVTLSSVSEGLRIVSQVSGPDFLFKDTEETVLHCLGSNLVAGDTAYHYWQKAEEVNGRLHSSFLKFIPRVST